MAALTAAQALETLADALPAGSTVDRAHVYASVAEMDVAVDALVQEGFEFVQRPRERYSYVESRWIVQAEMVLGNVGVHLREVAR